MKEFVLSHGSWSSAMLLLSRHQVFALRPHAFIRHAAVAVNDKLTVILIVLFALDAFFQKVAL